MTRDVHLQLRWCLSSLYSMVWTCIFELKRMWFNYSNTVSQQYKREWRFILQTSTPLVSVCWSVGLRDFKLNLVKFLKSSVRNVSLCPSVCHLLSGVFGVYTGMDREQCSLDPAKHFFILFSGESGKKSSSSFCLDIIDTTGPLWPWYQTFFF